VFNEMINLVFEDTMENKLCGAACHLRVRGEGSSQPWLPQAMGPL